MKKVFCKLVVSFIAILTTALANSASVLVYHHVASNTPKSTSVSVEQFKQHLGLIDELGLTVVPLTTITDAIKQQKTVNNNWVAITFDDGFRNVYENAYPLLQQKNIPFTIFVNPTVVRPSRLYASWSQLKTMAENGGVIANHTLNHENLVKDGLSREQIKQNLLDTEQAIIKHIGQQHKILAYPYGEYNDEVKGILNELNFVGFAQHSGAINETNDLQALPRFPANGIYANPKTLKNKLNSLPFSISSSAPLDTKPTSTAPLWKVTLADKDFYQSQLSCFISGQDKPVKPVWLSKMSFEIKAAKAIQSGRVKYNCTAPSIKHKGRFYWMSKLWIND